MREARIELDAGTDRRSRRSVRRLPGAPGEAIVSIRAAPSGTVMPNRPDALVCALPSAAGTPPDRGAEVIETGTPASGCPVAKASRPRIRAVRPNRTRTSPLLTRLRRPPELTLVSVKRDGVPAASLPALSRTLTHTSARCRLPRSSRARSAPLRYSVTRGRYGSDDPLRTWICPAARPENQSVTPTMMLPRFGRLRLTDGAVPSIITGFSTLAGLPEASVTVSRPVYAPSGGAAASASGRSVAFAHGTL